MAKLTKKIRINEYDVVNNQFNLTFQLSGYSDQLSFEALVADSSVLYIEGDSDDNLVGLGFSNGDIHQMINELVQWLEKPRKQLNDNSHIYTMRSRFEVAERLEQERRGKAAVERILVEAPCMDWAMSVTEELVDEAEEKPLIDIRTIIDHPSVVNTLDQITNGARMARSPETDTSAVEELNDTLNTAQQSVQAISDRIAAMETAGLGEEKPAQKLKDEDIEVMDTRGRIRPLSDVWKDYSTEGHALVENLLYFARQQWNNYSPTQSMTEVNRCAERAYNELHDYLALLQKPSPVPTMEAASFDNEEAKYLDRRKIADSRTEAAVTSIHKHARRFMGTATPREHDFLRSIIREEIEKVVGGVL